MKHQALKDRIGELDAAIVLKEEAIAECQADINSFEYSCTEDEFDNYLDETYPDADVCGFTYNASYALKELDPTAYRCMKADYESEYDLDDCDEYIELKEELERLEQELADLNTEYDEATQTLDDAIEAENNDE